MTAVAAVSAAAATATTTGTGTTHHTDGSKAICANMPNSTGVDEVVCRAFDSTLFQRQCWATQNDERALDLAMRKAGCETPAARKRRKHVMAYRASLANRTQSPTEEQRNLRDADLDPEMRVMPRNRTTTRDGTVFATDTDDKGMADSAQGWEAVGGYRLGLQAFSCTLPNMRNLEQWETSLVSVAPR